MKNKLKIFFPLILVFIFGVSAFAQTEAQVTKIRAAVTAINKNAAKYKKTTKSVEGISLEGTEATFFSSGAALKKTTAKVYGEMFNATVEIYYDGNMPIFIYQKLKTIFEKTSRIDLKNLILT